MIAMPSVPKPANNINLPGMTMFITPHRHHHQHDRHNITTTSILIALIMPARLVAQVPAECTSR